MRNELLFCKKMMYNVSIGNKWKNGDEDGT